MLLLRSKLPAIAACWSASLLAVASLTAAEPASPAVPPVRKTKPLRQMVLRGPDQPPEYRYTAFPSILRVSDDELWIAYKAGKTHGSDAGAAIDVVRHTLSTGETKLIERLAAPAPKLYQMGELARFSDGSIGVYVDVNHIGADGRTYRSGAEVFRWNAKLNKFDAPVPLGPVNGVLYGYPFDFITEGKTTWQLIMAFGYHQPGGRWSVDAIRSDDNGGTWKFVRNLTEEFGGIKANESGFVRNGDGFIVSTRGYDRIERLHRTDGDFKVLKQVDLTGKYPFVQSYIGRPRLFIRDGQGYMIGRNWLHQTGPTADPNVRNPMQLCLFRFDLKTLAITSCVVLDNADEEKLRDGYYAVPTFSGTGAKTQMHVITYKAMDKQMPDIVRFDYLWDDVK